MAVLLWREAEYTTIAMLEIKFSKLYMYEMFRNFWFHVFREIYLSITQKSMQANTLKLALYYSRQLYLHVIYSSLAPKRRFHVFHKMYLFREIF
jgi:hypothetical protein